MRLRSKIALVTGAHQGIGRAAAQLFADQGAYVYAADVNPKDPGFDGDVEYVQLDVTDPDDWKAIVEIIEATHGRLDVLVNAAGVAAFEAIHEVPLHTWNQVVAVNQTGVLLGMQSTIPLLRRADSASIINISSIWGLTAVPGAAAYHATKGAVLLLTKNAAMTYAGEGIRANSIHPGLIDTPMAQESTPEARDAVIAQTPLGRMGRPEEIANGILFLASDESSFMTGAELVIDGGYTAH